MPGKHEEGYQNEDEFVYDQLKNKEELKHIDDQNNINYDNALNQHKRKPLKDNPRNMHYGDLQEIDDIHEPTEKIRLTHRSRRELYTVDSILKRRNDFEEYDEGNKLTTKLYQEQTAKIKGESSLDPIGDLEAPKYTTRRFAVNKDVNGSMKPDSQIKQSKDSINPESIITLKYVQGYVSNLEHNVDKEIDNKMIPVNKVDTDKEDNKNRISKNLYKSRFKSPDEILGDKVEKRHKSRLEKLKKELDYNQKELKKKYGKSHAKKDTVSKSDKQSNLTHNVSSIKTFKDQKDLLQKEIKELDDELEKESHSLKNMEDAAPQDINTINHMNLLSEHFEPIPQVEEVKKQRLDDYRHTDPSILNFNENIDSRDTHQRQKYKNVIPTGNYKDRFNLIDDDQSDNKINPDTYLRIQDNEYTLRINIGEESPLYFNNRGKKYGHEYYHISKYGNPAGNEDDILKNEYDYNPEIKAIEEKYSSNKNQTQVDNLNQPLSSNEYNGPYSRYLDSPRIGKEHGHPSDFTSSGRVSPKELESSFINNIQRTLEEDSKSQKDHIIDVQFNPISGKDKFVRYHSKSDYVDTKDKEYYDSLNKTIQPNKGSKYTKQEQHGFDELDQIQPQIEAINPK